jgi:hypothetical protein
LIDIQDLVDRVLSGSIFLSQVPSFW